MPRWAARIFLEVTDVRVERLHSIKDADVVAEGIEKHEIDSWRKWLDPRDVHGHAFGVAWDQVYPKCPWKDNGWVSVTTFKRVEK